MHKIKTGIEERHAICVFRRFAASNYYKIMSRLSNCCPGNTIILFINRYIILQLHIHNIFNPSVNLIELL